MIKINLKTCHNFEIIHVRKVENYNYAYIVATSLEQATNIRKNKISFVYEYKDVSMDKPTDDDLANNLNRLKPKQILESEIRACMRKKNILYIYFKYDAQGNFMGVCNIQ